VEVNQYLLLSESAFTKSRIDWSMITFIEIAVHVPRFAQLWYFTISITIIVTVSFCNLYPIKMLSLCGSKSYCIHTGVWELNWLNLIIRNMTIPNTPRQIKRYQNFSDSLLTLALVPDFINIVWMTLNRTFAHCTDRFIKLKASSSLGRICAGLLTSHYLLIITWYDGRFYPSFDKMLTWPL